MTSWIRRGAADLAGKAFNMLIEALEDIWAGW